MEASTTAANRHIAPNLADKAAAGPATVDPAEDAPSRPIEDAEVEGYREQDRLLPIANVARIMRASLPPDAKISKEAKECVQECVSEFISFITSEGSDRCVQEKRKTINGEDVLWAAQVLGFDNYYDALKIYLAKYRTVANEGGKRRGRGRRDSTGAEPSRKRPRTTPGEDGAEDEEDGPDEEEEEEQEEEG